MHAPHVVLIDTQGTIMDYAVGTDILAQVFTLLQSTGERQDHPLLKSEYLETGKREPKPEPKPEIIADIPSFVPPQDKPAPDNVVRLTGGSDEPSIARGDDWQDCVVETPENPSEPDNAAFMTSLNSLFKST